MDEMTQEDERALDALVAGVEDGTEARRYTMALQHGQDTLTGLFVHTRNPEAREPTLLEDEPEEARH